VTSRPGKDAAVPRGLAYVRSPFDQLLEVIGWDLDCQQGLGADLRRLGEASSPIGC